MNLQLEHIWPRIQAQLALLVDDPTYRIWLEPLNAVELTDERLTIEAPLHACRWIRERFGHVIHDSVQVVLGPTVEVEIVSTETASPARPPTSASPTTSRSARHPPSTWNSIPAPHELPLGALANPKLTFDQFVIGDCNRLAHAAALTVAEMPAHAYNPLFICGPPGVGKTHLLSSIANLLSSHNPGLTIRCTTGEAFTNEFLASLSGGNTEAFKLRFRDVDVLLLDDVQFLERKAKTEEEFFHTFNALYDGGRQVVLSSDRPPQDLQALEDRLRERFQAGLVADIQPPDPSTRLTILRKRAHHDRIQLDDDRTLRLIAERVTANVRALEGALIRVVAFSSLTGRALTVELAREVLDGLYPHETPPGGPRACTIADIQAIVGQHFGISTDELLSASRTARVAWPRQLAMYLARELTDESLPAIGREFGGRDHTTVLHAWRRASKRISTDDIAREAVDYLHSLLNSRHS